MLRFDAAIGENNLQPGCRPSSATSRPGGFPKTFVIRTSRFGVRC